MLCESRANKSAELLAKYSDSILKKSNKTSAELDVEKILSEIVSPNPSVFLKSRHSIAGIQIVVFKFITDKDMFLEFYSKLFGNRLVKESSASEDQEQNMILKLKVRKGCIKIIVIL